MSNFARLSKPFHFEVKLIISVYVMLLIIPHCTKKTVFAHNYGKYGRSNLNQEVGLKTVMFDNKGQFVP